MSIDWYKMTPFISVIDGGTTASYFYGPFKRVNNP